MANKFRVNQLILSGVAVTATGTSLYLDGQIVSADTSSLASIANLYSTGSILYNYINNFSGVFNNSGTQYQNQLNTLTSNLQNTGISLKSSIDLASGNLITTGVNIGTKIDSLSGWVNNTSRVSSVNVTGATVQTGNITLSGLGSVVLFPGANNFVYISGSAVATSADHSDGINLSGNLTTTGQTLYNLINNFSGVFNNSGSQYQTQINTLTSNLQNTGISLKSSINLISGNIITTGQTLYQYITDTSGNFNTRLYQTGVDIIALINSSAGGVSSINNASGILSLTGRGNVTVISGGVGLIYISGDTGSLATLGQVNLGKSVFVSISGDDTLGLRGRFDKPFSTLSGGFTAAQSGDTIITYPGDYAVYNPLLVQKGVSFNFLGRGNVVSTGTIFSDNGAANSYVIDILAPGWTFDSQVSTCAAFNTFGAGKQVYFSFDTIRSNGTCVDVYAGRPTHVVLEGRKIFSTGGTPLIISAGEVVVRDCEVLTSSSGNDDVVLLSAGSKFTAENCSLYASGGINGTDCIGADGGELIFRNCSIVSEGADALTLRLNSKTSIWGCDVTGFTAALRTSDTSIATAFSSRFIGSVIENANTTIEYYGFDSLSGWVNNTPRVSNISVTGATAQTGNITLTGLGSITLFPAAGNNFIYISGSTVAASLDHSDGVNLSGNLTTTGQTLYNYITNFSGVFNNSGAQYQTQINTLTSNLQSTGTSLKSTIDLVSGNLITTGVTLGSKIDSLSGWVNGTSRVSSVSVTGATAQTGNIILTGLGSITLFPAAGNNFIYISGSTVAASADHGDGINLSGNLTTTGQTLYGYVTNTSGNLDTRIYQTGSNLYNLINNFSGVFNNSGTQYQTQINTLTSNLQSTGISLKSSIDLVSGNLITTGINLGLKIDSLSGWTNGTSRVSSISVTGATAQTGNITLTGLGSITLFPVVGGNFIYISGSPSATSDHGDGINLSGNLTTTGQTLYNLINNFSGVFNSSGAQYQTQINTLTSNLQSTGISLKSSINLVSGNLITTGVTLGSKIDSLSGWMNGTSRVSSISVTGAPVQTGNITLTGLGSIVLFPAAGNNFIYVSGQTGAVTNNYTINSGLWGVTGISVTGSIAITGFVFLTGETGIFTQQNGNTISISRPPESKSITVEYPVPGDDIIMFYTYSNIRVQKVSTMLRGILPSGIFSIKFDPSRGVAGTELLTNGFSVTGLNTGIHFTNFSQPIISGNNWVWMTVSATGGTFSGLHQTMFYNSI